MSTYSDPQFKSQILISLSNMGRRALLSHMKVINTVKCFFKAASATSETTEAPENKQLSLTVNNAD